MGKWQPVQPSELKVGDEFKLVVATTEVRGVVADASDCTYVIDENLEGWNRVQCQAKWFRRKPAKPTRPAEPPAGTVVRNTTEKWIGMRDDDHWWYVHTYDGQFVSSYNWDDWVSVGDTIEVAEWVKP